MGKPKSPRPGDSRNIAAPQTTHEENADGLFPVFCFQYLQSGFDFDAISMLTEETRVFLKRHDGAGCESIPQHRINVAIPRVLTADMIILAFRCSQKMRLIGWRKGRILHVVWLDPNHEVYDG